MTAEESYLPRHSDGFVFGIKVFHEVRTLHILHDVPAQPAVSQGSTIIIANMATRQPGVNAVAHTTRHCNKHISTEFVLTLGH